MIRIKEAVIVEGKYDKIRLSSLVDALIITTEGFGIFKDKEKMNMLRHLAGTRGLLVITDSDSAGFVIRNHLRSCIPPEHIKHAYIPDVFGKERRKSAPSKEGKLGVEGMSTEALLLALRRAGATCDEFPTPEGGREKKRLVTQREFDRCGLAGGDNSSAARAGLLAFLGLPEKMTAKSLLGVINDYMTYDEFYGYFGE